MSYSKKIKVPYMLCDRYKNLSIRNLISIMADISLNHSYILEKDMDMAKYRWIVYSWDVEIINAIRENDRIQVSTHVVGMNKFYAHRNFSIKRDGEIIVKAYGVFLLVDIDRMRPVKMMPELIETYKRDEKIYEKPSITYIKDFDESKEIIVRYTDIDSNFHVNNAVYFDYINDLCKFDIKDIKFFNIVYKNEIRNKKVLIGEYKKLNREIDYRLRSTEDNTIYSYGKIIRNV